MSKRYRSSLRIPVRREHWREPSYLLPSGLRVIPQGRRSIMCEMGLHKWTIKSAFGVPFLSCLRCGYLAPKPVLEHTARKRELIEITQREMAKQQPILPVNPTSERELLRAKEKLILKCFNRYQQYKKTKRGTLRYIGDRR